MEKIEIKMAHEFEEFRQNTEPFMRLMMEYRCALKEIQTKLEVLNEEFMLNYDRNPFEAIKSRIKMPRSILEKMQRRGIEITVENIEQNLFDVAGIRVICSYPKDIYKVADMLIQQDDIVLVGKKDYIQNPKPNGYRSLHLIVEVPIFLSNQKKPMKVEVQLRTIAMDFWASLEHKLKYKKDINNPEEISHELKDIADIISATDLRMQELHKKIYY